MTTRGVAGSVTIVVLLSLSAGPQAAAEIKGSGTNTYVVTSQDILPLSEEISLLRSKSQTILLADDPKLPFHLSTQDCAGTYVVKNDGGVTSGNGYCDTVDGDGDIWWMWWKTEGETGSWGVLAGTGKYEGMTGGGTTKTISQAPDGRFALSWEGAWEMK